MKTESFRIFLDFLNATAIMAILQILKNSTVKKIRLLRYESDMISEGKFYIFQIVSV